MMRFIYVSSLVMALVGCDKSSGGKGNQTDVNHSLDSNPAEQTQMLTDTVEVVIIPTYQELSKRADALLVAVTTFDKDRSQTNLDAMRAAWSATRSPWEQNEGFLFGPVEIGGYDEAIDTWPLNATDLRKVLTTTTTDAKIATADRNQKGFHAAEFVIYGENTANFASFKPVSAFTDNEMAYLSAVVRAISKIGQQLAADWSTAQGDKPAYKDTLITAGEPGNTTYPSRQAAMQTLIEKMAGICHEVSSAKIATPLSTRAASDVESQFSFNSLKDFADNVRSVQNIYTGTYPTTGKSGASLSALVAKSNPDLDQRMKKGINDAITAIQAIPEPFPKAIADSSNDAVISAAQHALNDLETLLLNDVEALVK
jgi:predicted lipoprotein